MAKIEIMNAIAQGWLIRDEQTEDLLNIGKLEVVVNEELNKNSEAKRIIVNKSPLLSNNKKYMKTFSSPFYLRKANTNKLKPPLISYKSNLKNRNKNKKLPSLANIPYINL